MKYWNNQKYCECQLVALWNAAIFYGIKVPKRYGKEYYQDCDKACAIHGGCISKEHVMSKLGLKPAVHKMDFNWVKKNIPVEFQCFCHRGYHSILAVAFDKKRNKFCVTNFTRNKCHFLSWNEIKKMQNKQIKIKSWKKRGS